MIYVISDNHWGHANMLKPEFESRPFTDCYEMDMEMIRRWNNEVKEDDLVIFVGDLILTTRGAHALITHRNQVKELLDRLNGKKILIKGNHDKHSNRYYLEAGFYRVYKHLYLNSKWGQILFVHRITDIKNKFLADDFDFCFFGHTHSKGKSEGRFYNCCVEVNDYTPFDLRKKIQEIMERNKKGK